MVLIWLIKIYVNYVISFSKVFVINRFKDQHYQINHMRL